MDPLTAGELLRTLREYVTRDLVSDYLWSDQRLVDLLNEAYLEFAGESLLIRDFSGAYSIALAAGEPTYPYPTEVLSVMSARFAGAHDDLLRTHHSVGRQGDGVMAFATDDQHQSITFYSTPTSTDAGKEVLLRVARLPSTLFTVDDPSLACELPRQYAAALPYGAAALAYLDQDSEGGDPARARNMRAVFDQYLARAKRYARMAMHQPIGFAFNVPQ